MRTTRELRITLSNDTPDATRSHVTSGAYASESGMIRDGPRASFAREAGIASWRRAEVTGAYDE